VWLQSAAFVISIWVEARDGMWSAHMRRALSHLSHPMINIPLCIPRGFWHRLPGYQVTSGSDAAHDAAWQGKSYYDLADRLQAVVSGTGDLHRIIDVSCPWLACTHLLQLELHGMRHGSHQPGSWIVNARDIVLQPMGPFRRPRELNCSHVEGSLPARAPGSYGHCGTVDGPCIIRLDGFSGLFSPRRTR
jgi:hypothetical protein